MSSCINQLFQEGDYHINKIKESQIKKHNHDKNAWIIINNTVYALNKNDKELLDIFKDYYGKNATFFIKETMTNKEIILLMNNLSSRKIGNIL